MPGVGHARYGARHGGRAGLDEESAGSGARPVRSGETECRDIVSHFSLSWDI